MGKTVKQLLREIDSLELTRWAAYERVAGPLGGIRGDIQAGIVAATVANVFGDENSEPSNPLDFLPEWGAKTEADEEVHGG